MTTATAYEKRSITVPRDVVDDVNSVMGPGNFSAYVTEALRRQVQRDKLAQLISELTAEHGPVTAAEYEQALEELTT